MREGWNASALCCCWKKRPHNAGAHSTRSNSVWNLLGDCATSDSASVTAEAVSLGSRCLGFLCVLCALCASALGLIARLEIETPRHNRPSPPCRTLGRVLLVHAHGGPRLRSSRSDRAAYRHRGLVPIAAARVARRTASVHNEC